MSRGRYDLRSFGVDVPVRWIVFRLVAMLLRRAHHAAMPLS